MSQLDIQVCINPVTAALPGKGLPWCGAGDTAGASARGGQEEARAEAVHGGLNHGVAQSEMPPKKNEDSTWTIGGGGRVVQSCCSDPPGRV